MRAAGDEERPIYSINLSGSSLGEAGMLDFIKSGIIASGLALRSVCFEITETVGVSNFSLAIHLIQEFRRFGCRFALDDFGSGLSSYNYLKHLPADCLRIDGSFVRDMVQNALDRAIVESANQVAHAIGIMTVAEWVEDRDTLELLRRIGVDFVQGYVIEKPQP